MDTKGRELSGKHAKTEPPSRSSGATGALCESCLTSFIAEEKDFLLPLPESPYEPAEWDSARVQRNCHVVYLRKYYSVPFEYLGEEVDIRATRLAVELFYHHRRIASHRRLYGKEEYSTVREHMPPDKLFFTDWDKERFLEWSAKIGVSTRRVVESIFDRSVVEQQACRPCFGVLALGNKYGALRLERASTLVLSRTSSPSYSGLKSVLEKNLDLPATSNLSSRWPNTKDGSHTTDCASNLSRLIS